MDGNGSCLVYSSWCLRKKTELIHPRMFQDMNHSSCSVTLQSIRDLQNKPCELTIFIKGSVVTLTSKLVYGGEV